jgi:predicted DNA-binding WGR domain protein
MKRNLIAHCESGSSDKIYMSCIRENPDGTFSTLAKWGRRGKTLQQTFKLTNVTETQAYAEQKKVFDQKLKGGYVDIDDSSYNGPVTTLTVKDFLEEDNGATAPKPKAKPKKVTTPKPKPVVQKEGIALCVNNAGMEDKFDQDIEYVFEAHSDPTMIYVYDKLGKKGEFFSDRFEVTDES